MLSDKFCPCFIQTHLRNIKKKKKACESKWTVCFTIEQNILVDSKRVWEGGFSILFFILMSASLFLVNVPTVSRYPVERRAAGGC